MQRMDEGNLTVLVPGGDIQNEVVEELDVILNKLVQKNIKRIALDMTDVGYIYSKGVGVLIKNHKLLKAKGGALYLFNLKASMRKILREVNLIEPENGRAWIRLEGTIDSDKDLKALRKDFNQLMETGINEINIDLTNLIYMDDQAVLELIEVSKKLKSSSGKAMLKGPNEIILDQLGMMGAREYFEFE
jgi:anti-anti-sigma factor